jgi:flagellar hook-associated protein 2
LQVSSNIDAVKDSIISFVGNYNRLMAEINILTRNDERVINDITYFDKDEIEEARKKLGTFSTDSTLSSLRNSLQRLVSAPYPTSMERELSMLSQIGISTNATRGTGFDSTKLHGYLEINPKTLDAALENNLMAVKQLFGNDTTGDMLADTGVAFNIDTLSRPYVETNGIISLKTNTIDSRIRQDERRIEGMERQLAIKEQELKIQYARMESAYSQMERMSDSLDNFNRQNRGNNR